MDEELDEASDTATARAAFPDSSGGLNDRLVSLSFWPACSNCAGRQECASAPLHAAYPHNWHWGHEATQFADGKLVHLSWVGSSVIGEAHTGCTSYRVDERCLLSLRPEHEEYARLESLRRELDNELEGYERDNIYNETVSGKYDELEGITRRQQALLAA